MKMTEKELDNLERLLELLDVYRVANFEANGMMISMKEDEWYEDEDDGSPIEVPDRKVKLLNTRKPA